MIYRECYKKGKAILQKASILEAELDARLLLEYVCGTDRNTLLAHGDKEVAPERVKQYEELIGRRGKRIPLQYLTGTQEFMGLSFAVNEHVLIPRQDTEILVEEVLRNLHDGMRILDMCTGSGCILISLAYYSNDCQGVGVDISEEALKIARANGTRLLSGKRRVNFADNDTQVMEGDIIFQQGDLFGNVTGKYDVIVSNPPYIRSGEMAGLMPEVKEHEPAQALDGGEDGLYFYREIVKESRGYLMGGGMLFLEIGWDQAAEVRALMEKAGFAGIEVVKDYGGHDRVVYGTLGPKP